MHAHRLNPLTPVTKKSCTFANAAFLRVNRSIIIEILHWQPDSESRIYTHTHKTNQHVSPRTLINTKQAEQLLLLVRLTDVSEVPDHPRPSHRAPTPSCAPRLHARQPCEVTSHPPTSRFNGTSRASRHWHIHTRISAQSPKQHTGGQGEIKLTPPTSNPSPNPLPWLAPVAPPTTCAAPLP